MDHYRKYLEFIGKERGSEKDVKEYMTYLANSNLKDSVFMEISNSLNFKISRDKLRKRVIMLKEEEVRDIIDAITDLRYKVLISIVFYSGMKVGDVVNLELKDVKLKNELIIRDKMIGIDDIFRVNVNNYLKKVDGNKLFGNVCVRDVQKALEVAAKKNDIKGAVYCYSLK